MNLACKRRRDQALAPQHFLVCRRNAAHVCQVSALRRVFSGCHSQALRLTVWEEAAGNTPKGSGRRRVVKGWRCRSLIKPALGISALLKLPRRRSVRLQTVEEGKAGQRLAGWKSCCWWGWLEPSCQKPAILAETHDFSFTRWALGNFFGGVHLWVVQCWDRWMPGCAVGFSENIFTVSETIVRKVYWFYSPFSYNFNCFYIDGCIILCVFYTYIL